MRLYRCDRCKKEYAYNEHGINEGALGLRNPTETCLTIDLPVDLCDDCRKDFENWFRQPMVDKAFEEAHAKAHAHERNDVTILGIGDKYVCPVCGCIIEFTEDLPLVEKCPKCNSIFNDRVNWVGDINLKKPKRGDVNEKNTTGTENRVGNDTASPSRKVGDSDNGNQRV